MKSWSSLLMGNLPLIVRLTQSGGKKQCLCVFISIMDCYFAGGRKLPNPPPQKKPNRTEGRHQDFFYFIVLKLCVAYEDMIMTISMREGIHVLKCPFSHTSSSRINTNPKECTNN